MKGAGAGLRITILGAESTGKSTLAARLAAALTQRTGLRCTWVPEWLRTWCDAHGRTPRRHEQAAIADEQRRQIDEAARSHDLVVCDTTPLMTALYSIHYFDDRSLMPRAIDEQRAMPLTLLTRPDLPWEPDGFQRESPEVRQRVDDELVALLDAEGIGWCSVAGDAPQRLATASDAVMGLLRRTRSQATASE